MDEIIASRFWWEKVTGPNYIVSTIARSLTEGVSVVISVPDDLPWRHSMRNTVRTILNREYGQTDALIDSVDVKDSCPEEEPGMYILRTWGDRETSSNYRKSSTKTIQDYLIENEVLKKRILWIKGLSNRNAKKWRDFIEHYNSSNLDYGLFVLETNEADISVNNEAIQLIAYDKYVSSYDVQMLCNYLLYNNNDYSNEWKEYIAILVSKLCVRDGEVAEYVMCNFNFRDSDYMGQITSVSKEQLFIYRGVNEQSDSLLKLARENDTEEINKRIWTAQIQELFPLIELERVSIVRSLFSRIQTVLSSYQIEQFNLVLSDPLDVELGTLVFLIHSHMKLNDYNLVKRIEFLHDCRNLIAHGNCCSFSQIDQLFKIKR